MADKFSCEKCSFQGSDGFEISQIHNGKVITSQFIPEGAYLDFCKAAGIDPKEVITYRYDLKGVDPAKMITPPGAATPGF